MNKEKKRKYIFAQLNSLPNAFQYVEVTNYIKSLEQENQQLHNKIDKIEEWLKYKAEALDTFDIPKRKETGAFWYTTRGEIDGLLEILKDSNVNE